MTILYWRSGKSPLGDTWHLGDVPTQAGGGAFLGLHFVNLVEGTQREGERLFDEYSPPPESASFSPSEAPCFGDIFKKARWYFARPHVFIPSYDLLSTELMLGTYKHLPLSAKTSACFGVQNVQVLILFKCACANWSACVGIWKFLHTDFRPIRWSLCK